jgi:hypothetical protein
MNRDARDSGVSLAELLASFSFAMDLGLGQPMEHVLRSWRLAARLGKRVGLNAEGRTSSVDPDKGAGTRNVLHQSFNGRQQMTWTATSLPSAQPIMQRILAGSSALAGPIVPTIRPTWARWSKPSTLNLIDSRPAPEVCCNSVRKREPAGAPHTTPVSTDC